MLPGLGDAHQRGGISPPRDADYVEFTWDAAVVNQRREIVAGHG
jgi:hypothetical protein